MDGFLIVDKPKGITSQSACSKIKYLLGEKKVGHAGTLDPNATGVMVIALGKATKALKLIESDSKSYVARILFGITTDTLDICGNILDKKDMIFSLHDLVASLEKIKKQETQIPPLTSAIKVDGKKLYEYQREGKDVNVLPRKVTLNSYKIVSDLERVDNHFEISIFVDVSKGYYVRSFARDLGKLLGGYAILKDLRRVRSGNSKIEDAIKLNLVKKEDIIPIFSFLNLKRVNVKDYLIPLVKNGITLDNRQTNLNEPFYVDSSLGILAIYEPKGNGVYKPVILFGGEDGNH